MIVKIHQSSSSFRYQAINPIKTLLTHNDPKIHMYMDFFKFSWRKNEERGAFRRFYFLYYTKYMRKYYDRGTTF